MDIGLLFANGTINTTEHSFGSDTRIFIPHKTFPGVALKHLVTGGETDGAVSCHLVRVEPHCRLDNHSHPGNFEIHQVISGSGTFELGTNTGVYETGTTGIIPTGINHKITAGANGLYLLATFSPALL